MASILKGAAYITGAASGIGKATAFALARNGISRLALTDVSQKNLDSTSKELKEKFPKLEIACMQLDVCDGQAIESSVVETVKIFGRIDVGVNVAGIGGSGKATDVLEESGWLKVIDVNLNGVWRSQKAQIRAMLKQENLGIREGRGNIINVASMYGLDANAYAAQGIRINAICPGYVRTPLLQESTEAGLMDVEIAKTPMGRMAEVEEIGDLSERLKRSLYSISAGELPINAAKLEGQLSRIFKTSSHWNAIILLDEADVFLEKWSSQDLNRNALVSVFLPILNRIHVMLRYDDLSKDAGKKVWEQFIKRASMSEGPARINSEELKSLVDSKLNGRQIKNFMVTVDVLATKDKSPVLFSHLRKAVTASKKFITEFNGRVEVN
ncbi:hypothetical protein G7Y89_g1523 [Cudoniella acicularis]|uniref:Uncharacterized protein n=1 Tax=Cudoniella acicularis TaxID=354080 RepID=A0A8H4RV23_9HELO|nr:hypothetical protein G7Y89_g1523 [Cudoniella acicularis]